MKLDERERDLFPVLYIYFQKCRTYTESACVCSPQMFWDHVSIETKSL